MRLSTKWDVEVAPKETESRGVFTVKDIETNFTFLLDLATNLNSVCPVVYAVDVELGQMLKKSWMCESGSEKEWEWQNLLGLIVMME